MVCNAMWLRWLAGRLINSQSKPEPSQGQSQAEPSQSHRAAARGPVLVPISFLNRSRINPQIPIVMMVRVSGEILTLLLICLLPGLRVCVCMCVVYV